MTPAAFRRIALSMPEAVEGSHMGHADFRVTARKGVFATLFGAREQHGMVRLTPDQQRRLVSAKPQMFAPIPGGWGDKGCTQVFLPDTDAESLRNAIEMAWLNLAPKRLSDRLNRPPAPAILLPPTKAAAAGESRRSTRKSKG